MVAKAISTLGKLAQRTDTLNRCLKNRNSPALAVGLPSLFLLISASARINCVLTAEEDLLKQSTTVLKSLVNLGLEALT